MLYNSLMQAIFAIVKARKYTALLLLVLLFSFVTKAWRINQPDEYYFDEIYYGLQLNSTQKPIWTLGFLIPLPLKGLPIPGIIPQPESS